MSGWYFDKEDGPIDLSEWLYYYDCPKGTIDTVVGLRWGASTWLWTYEYIDWVMRNGGFH